MAIFLSTLLCSSPSGGTPLGETLPLFSMGPFALMLLCIAVLPLVAPHWWHHNRNRAMVSFLLGTPMAIWMAYLDLGVFLHTFHEYAAFIILLGSLFIISGGVLIRGSLAGTPGINTLILALGGLMASFIGTTGAAMLLIRPLLRANAPRKRKVHVMVFFIFIVANVGGLLTPLGDPPLFLGFFRGVPFFWTLGLWAQWLFMLAVLLLAFFIIDSFIFRKEDIETPGDLDEEATDSVVPIRIEGKINLVLLLGVVVVIYLSGTYKPPVGIQEGAMVILALLSMVLTPRRLREENEFSWEPIVEVTVVFAGIFATMIPAMAILNAKGAQLGVTEPWQFFWATGILSSFLDNAPTYLAFSAVASGLEGTNSAHLNELLLSANGEVLLQAISLGAVFMGAMTYIGNGPNFMVKAVAEQAGIKMPSFFGYIGYSAIILLPCLLALTFIFLV